MLQTLGQGHQLAPIKEVGMSKEGTLAQIEDEFDSASNGGSEESDEMRRGS